MTNQSWSCFFPPVSRNVLDNFGLTVNLRMLKAWPAYQAARDRYFGTHRLHRWWMKWVYPLLYPRRYDARFKDWLWEQAALRQEYIAAVKEASQ